MASVGPEMAQRWNKGTFSYSSLCKKYIEHFPFPQLLNPLRIAFQNSLWLASSPVSLLKCLSKLFFFFFTPIKDLRELSCCQLISSIFGDFLNNFFIYFIYFISFLFYFLLLLFFIVIFMGIYIYIFFPEVNSQLNQTANILQK